MVRTNYTSGDVRRVAQRVKNAAQARRLLAIAGPWVTQCEDWFFTWGRCVKSKKPCKHIYLHSNGAVSIDLPHDRHLLSTNDLLVEDVVYY